MKIKNKILDKFIDWYYRKKALRTLLSTKREDVAVHAILEAYLTNAIVSDGKKERRGELADIQMRVVETKNSLIS